MSVPKRFDVRQFALFNSALPALESFMHVCSAGIRKFHARLSFDVRSDRRQFNLFSCVKEAQVTTQIFFTWELAQIVDPSAGDNRQLLQKKCRCRGTGCGRAGGGVHLVLCFSRGLCGKPQTHGEKAKRFLSPRAKIIGLHCVLDLSELRNGVQFGVGFGLGFLCARVGEVRSTPCVVRRVAHDKSSPSRVELNGSILSSPFCLVFLRSLHLLNIFHLRMTKDPRTALAKLKTLRPILPSSFSLVFDGLHRLHLIFGFLLFEVDGFLDDTPFTSRPVTSH